MDFLTLDPRKRWHRGTTYLPPLVVPLNALSYASAVRVVPGMIVYKVFKLQKYVAKGAVQTAVTQNAEMKRMWVSPPLTR